MEKVIRDGKVAVIYHPGFGAGWYTWNDDYKELMYHPQLVQKVLDDEQKDLTEEWVKSILGIAKDKYICVLAAGGLEIKWLDVEQDFRIKEYDGSEDIVTISDLIHTA